MQIPREEFSSRLSRVQRQMEQGGIGFLLVYSKADISYLSGYDSITGESMVLVPHTGEGILIIDQEWDLLRARDISALDDTRADEDFAGHIITVLKESDLGDTLGVVGWQSLPAPLYVAIKEAFPNLVITDFTDALTAMRMVKSPAEIAFIEEAARITDEGVQAATEAISEGASELQVAVAAETAMKLAGARELSFPTVLGSGTRTELIVPFPTDKTITRGDLVLMDMGGRYKGYCGDMSRTKVCGTPTQEQRELFEVVTRMHREAVDAVRPGVKASELHTIACRVAQDAGYGQYVAHMTGHGVGLEEHELPILETDDTLLVPGVVHSIEPGLYVPGVGGMRLEDLVLVTEEGHRVLTSFDRGL